MHHKSAGVKKHDGLNWVGNAINQVYMNTFWLWTTKVEPHQQKSVTLLTTTKDYLIFKKFLVILKLFFLCKRKPNKHESTTISLTSI